MNPAPPPLAPRPPERKLTGEDHAELLRRLQAPFDAKAPTLLMGVLLAVSVVLFCGIVCFVAYNDYDRTHLDVSAEEIHGE